MKSNQYPYDIILILEDEGGYSVSVPELPGCFTQGETKEEAIKMAHEAIELYLESLEVDKIMRSNLNHPNIYTN